MTAHIHAALMAQYAQDAAETDKPWERWQCFKDGLADWIACESHGDMFLPTWAYRRKPRTHMVNGIEVPAPMRDAPKSRQKIWIAIPGDLEFADGQEWRGDSFDLRWLERGLVHATKEAAAANAMAMIGRKV